MRFAQVSFALTLFSTLVACSSSSSSGTPSAGSVECGSSNATKASGTTCTATTVTGLCSQSLGYDSATLEAVCAAGPDGSMYIVEVNGDTTLSGTGWTFGPRAFGSAGSKLYPVEAESLSSSDQTRCNQAQAACSPFAAHDAGDGD